MDQNEIFAKIIAILRDGFTEAAIKPRTTLGELGLDSLDIEALKIDIEKHFDIDLYDERWTIETTVSALSAGVHARDEAGR